MGLRIFLSLAISVFDIIIIVKHKAKENLFPSKNPFIKTIKSKNSIRHFHHSKIEK